MTDGTPALPPRHSRVWLFAPFVLLALAVAGWSTAWFLIRNATTDAIDDWLAAEAAQGRQWQCVDRTVGGYPFRITISCDALSLQRPGASLALGAVTAVAQVYAPRHVIVHAAGPLRAGDGRMGVDGTWRLLQASVRTVAEGGFQRLSLAVDEPALRVTGAPGGDLALSAGRLETHLRPSPTRDASEGAYDWTLGLARLNLPVLDTLIGGAEPADLDLQVTATRARDVKARPWTEELERWREAGGRLEVTTLALAKGRRFIDGAGQFGLDEAHRVQGRAELAATGLEGLVGTLLGARGGATAALLGALIGQPIAPDPAPEVKAKSSKPGLKPLPPVRLDEGRVFIGTLPLPGVRLPPLY
jgi:hypothetical protein